MTRRAVVTGGTGGIGLQTALGLAAAGHAVTVVGRSAERGARAVERIEAVATAEPPRFLAADLASLGAVRELAGRLADDGPLSVLVNNVGTFATERRLTTDGVEANFAVNHLSPYLLTELLVDTVAASERGRVVNVSSASVRAASRQGFDTVEPRGGYYAFHWYGRAKLANLAWTLELANRLRDRGVGVLAADPGGAATEMTDSTMTRPAIVHPAMRTLWPVLRRVFARSTAGPADLAARSSIAAAIDPAFDGRTGLLLGPDCTPTTPHRRSTDPATVRAVLELSRRLAPLSEPSTSAPA
ncbi:SDR family NAD(P)-dependent oxidoreductase [Streptomyces lonarensis]|uniref:SDR family NAD(P)-dependent oxidoreductase n=1 Tax=Streptomyces lonarensis TaxID=700599 RepID=A0A7X6D0R1_9ACTN|nr:SDR family NAD(P)-dependent oxidoreductase [Streptomyces lonarensis]NJQ06093.1 SDR family NAD(P)-dependent oxidoreductase [Streptomyces lonarensis]